mmetsp:Transcript_14451/g.34967  ORF Transcript_14451/g.34967 Transcript_14451/m.34967 type:complete len:276 (+) Transcript_14451:81-908(+)|eukprot:CAMPEP_0113610534 /NCGR_PEP_ID=MMETSP0017_2-20120614/5079_1 /TAXON_ID=2856 /ORGANISM="Cylindrotheca closterium" /LENGTH=275 /DNA_ID=CAMNT_0000519431 /DNA_START=80 /DNA_END=907 /DNA_ORIENTATION=- /assembly_acc=CAM_ASM_000147
MKISVIVYFSLCASVTSFQPSASRKSVGLKLAQNDEDTHHSRRVFLNVNAAIVAGIATQGFFVNSASAGLLDEYGADPSKIQDAAKATESATPSGSKVKVESNLEPNLRSNYYYPTNKKRYLPRIKKCNDAIPDAATMIGQGDWEGAEIFAIKIADDTILPMKLYTSSLLGGGTNVKVAFAQDMTKAAKDFEKAQKALVKAIGKKDQEKSSRALEDLSAALLSYRTAGKLLGADGGGDIPSVDEIRRSACRVQGRTFEEKIKSRDARLAEAAKAQ